MGYLPVKPCVARSTVRRTSPKDRDKRALVRFLLRSPKGLAIVERPADAKRGGRSWWAHFDLTQINIEPTFEKEEIEE
jgi:hypothetical protein